MTRYEKTRGAIRRGWILTSLALFGLVAVYLRVAFFTPIDTEQGQAQKIFYVHVPSAWAALLAFALVGILSLIYLLSRDRKIDTLAAASAEVGMVFGFIMLTTGPIWGKAVWGAPWAWDARLTSALFLFFLFLGYMVLRGELVDRNVRARFSAVIGVLALILAPFTFFSVYIFLDPDGKFRGQHPDPAVLRAGGPDMPASMILTLLLSVLVFTLLYLGFLQLRYSLGILSEMREDEYELS